MDGYQPRSFFFTCFGPRRSRGHKHAKTERGQYAAILTEQAWSIKDLLCGFRRNLSCGIQRVVPSGQDSSMLNGQPITAHDSVNLAHQGASHIIIRFLHLISVWMSDLKKHGLQLWETEKTNTDHMIESLRNPLPMVFVCLTRFLFFFFAVIRFH